MKPSFKRLVPAMKKLILIIGLALSLSFPAANAEPGKGNQMSQIGTEVAAGKGAGDAKADKKADK